MKQTNKKGFTIVELVIVIAVIAILAAVLIPTFVSITKKANLSADQQAVRQMNTLLATYVNGEVRNIAEVKTRLSADGIDANNYKPLSAGHDFFWIPSLNRVVLVDAEGTVVYPTDLADDAASLKDSWRSLGGLGNTEKVEEFVSTIGKENLALSGTTNLQGASVNLKPSKNVTIGGADADNKATVENFVSDEGSYVASNTGEFADNTYYAGFISVVPENTEVVVENMVFSNAVVGDTINPDSARAGIVAGQVNGKLTIRNVVIENCEVFGSYRIGALVGAVGAKGEVVIENVTIKDTTVKGAWITAALIGQVNGKVTITNVTEENLKVEASEFNGAVTDTSKIMTVNGFQFGCEEDGTTGYPYLTTEDYWVEVGDDITDANYPGITFWNYKGQSGNK